MLFNRIGLKEYQMHATSHPWIGNMREHIEHPICPRCEKICLRGNGQKGSWERDRIAACPSCGWHGRATTLANEYIQEEMYRR